MPGKLFVVSTPIGNLKDITLRALETLREVDFILAEDSRVTSKLLKHYKIDKKIFSYNSFSSEKKNEKIISELLLGKNIALVSDAGTPSISDPGVKILSILRERFGEEIEIIPIPGATAFVTALSVSGISSSTFVFYGFLPHKKGREKIFKEIAELDKVAVFYESPNRVLKSLESLLAFCNPERKVFVARELTKIYEEKKLLTLKEAKEYFQKNKDKVKGEFVLILDKKDKKAGKI